MNQMSHYSVQAISAQDYATSLESLRPQLPAPLHFLQAGFYGEWQQKSGKHVTHFEIKKSGELIGCGMAIAYPLPGGFHYLYCPYGPLLTDWSAGAVDALKYFFKHEHGQAPLFVRFDADNMPEAEFTEPSNAAAATASLQPRREWALDISPSEEKLLEGFHKTARYHLRLAERSNTTIRFEHFTPVQLDHFYDLMLATSDRNSFGILPKSYYKAVFETLHDTPDSFLAFADIDGVPAAAVLVASYDGQAHYVFGCSGNQFRRIAPSYLLLWHSIQKAKANGNTVFNFGGITDSIKSTRLQGVTEFKKRFGGYEIAHDKPADIVLSPVLYKLFTLYKKIQRH